MHYSESPSDEYIAINLQADIDYIDYLQQKWDQGTYSSANRSVRRTPQGHPGHLEALNHSYLNQRHALYFSICGLQLSIIKICIIYQIE